MSFYVRDLSVHRFWYLQGTWNQSLMDIEGQLYIIFIQEGELWGLMVGSKSMQDY